MQIFHCTLLNFLYNDRCTVPEGLVQRHESNLQLDSISHPKICGILKYMRESTIASNISVPFQITLIYTWEMKKSIWFEKRLIKWLFLDSINTWIYTKVLTVKALAQIKLNQLITVIKSMFYILHIAFTCL